MPSFAKAVSAGLRATTRRGMAWMPCIVAVSAPLLGCGASDRSLLFNDSDPSPAPVVVPSGAGGMPAAVLGSGGLLSLPMRLPSQSSGGATMPHSSPTSTGGNPAPPADGNPVPPGDGGAPDVAPGARDGGAPGAPMDPTTSVDAGAARCDFAGTWATIIRVPVTWPEAPLVLYGGQGEVIQWNISHRVRSTLTTYQETSANCGIYLPDLSGAVLTLNQKFGIRFPSDMFDKGEIPPAVFAATTSVVGLDVQYEAGPVISLTGLVMPDATTAPWPATLPVGETPDEDHDGMPGVTVVAVDPGTDPSYNWPPVGLPPSLGADYPRAARIAVAVRTVANLRGTATDCNEIRAAVDIPLIGGNAALNSMVIACMKTTGEPCTDAEASFLNGERPQFTPSGPGTLVSVRVPDAAGCPDVRTRLPQ